VKMSSMFIAASVLSLLFGLAAVLIPTQFLSFYGVTTDSVGTLTTSLFGGELLGLAALFWLGRNVESPVARNAMVLGGFVSTGIGFVLTLLAQIAGVLNSLGWINVVIYLFLALGFGYLLIPRTAASTMGSTAP
jgi:hypothetical protein